MRAQASCAAYSVVATAHANGLDDRKYAEWLQAEMPNDPSLRRGEADILRYLTWSPEVPESCMATGSLFIEKLEKAGGPVIDSAGLAERGAD